MARVWVVCEVPGADVYCDTNMAHLIGRTNRADVSAETFAAVGEILGVPPRVTRRAVAELGAHAERWLPDLPSCIRSQQDQQAAAGG